jgi:ATP-dependent DNA helicase RecQ
MQEDVIKSVLSDTDTLALMPTGGGKSLCYQVPALAREGLCLVISPLIALMKDQVENLRKKSITAFSINSGMSRKEVIAVLRLAANSNCKFLYVSPERLETSLFREYLPALGVSLIAVDEAHCISQWGYDFRPPYLRIAALREELPGVPVLALTASATPEVQADICKKLSVASPAEKDWAVFRQSFERSNLSYSVFRVDSAINKIAEILKKVPGTAIVYCKSRRRTKEISELLSMQGLSADYYHAGLSQEDRSKKQEAWIRDKTAVIVCTNAFGMGIDKPNVRVVIHADAPECLENYYQEAGRAGRDGKRSYAVLLFRDKDIRELKELSIKRFPAEEEIKNVYQSLANYFQIASGAGEGIYHDFDIGDFSKKFKLDPHVAVNSLKLLEQEGWLSFNEQVFLPPTVRFLADRNYLQEFETLHPQLEPLIKSLLRGYEGIFEYPCAISDSVLAKLTNTDREEIKKQLTLLHQYQVIDYAPQKEKPQICLLRNRIRVEELMINRKDLEARKGRFTKRLDQMIAFIGEPSVCRSKMIGNYFGDADLKDCGICDNCLAKKERPLQSEEFEKIRKKIADVMAGRTMHTKELLAQLNDIKQEKAWKAIRFLQDEKMIEVDGMGFVKMKR